MSETKGTALEVLSLTEIAERIDRHLSRMERSAQKVNGHSMAVNPDGTVTNLRLFSANATRMGNRVGVTYVSYQGRSSLTRDEALSYLAGLDGGYVGRHYEWLREHPVEQAEEPEVRFTALVCQGGRFFLYDVTKRTDKRVYGKARSGYWSPSYVGRDDVLRWQADEGHLDAIHEAQKQRDAAIREAEDTFQRRVREITGAPNDR